MNKKEFIKKIIKEIKDSRKNRDKIVKNYGVQENK